MTIRRSIALALPFFLLPPVAPSLAVVVHGTTSVAVGTATLSVTGNAATGYALEIDNIGSSGQDGVAIQLPALNGVSLVYGPHSTPGGEPIVHRDLACRALVDGSLESLAHLIEDRDLLGVRTYLDVPGSPPVTIEAWNGPDLVYSAVHPAGTPIEAAGIAIDEPGVHVTMAFEDQDDDGDGVTIRTVEATVVRSHTPITIYGENFVANRYVLRAGIPLAPTIRCSDATIRMACDGGGGGGGGGALGRMAIKAKGLPGPRDRSPRSASLPRIFAVSGALLESVATPDIRLHVSRPAGDPDPMVLRLNGLPPGVPYIGDLRVRLTPSFLTDVPGQSFSIQARVLKDPADGTAPSEVTDHATWTTTGSGRYRLDASTGSSDGSVTYHLYRGPRQSTSLDGSFSHPISSRAFRSHRVRCQDGTCQLSFGFPSDVVITVNGAVQDADSIVVEYRSPSTNAIGLVDETWTLNAISSLTLREAECRGGRNHHPYGVALSATGNAEIVPDWVARRREIRNLGSSGEDGVSLRCEGSSGVDVPFDPPVSMANFSKIEWKTRDCDDGDDTFCPSSVRVRCFGAGQPRPQTCDVSMPNAGGPAYVWVDLGDAGMHRYTDLDSDGDGLLELTPMPGQTLALAGARFRRILDEGHAGERFTLLLGAPVTMMVSGQPRIIDNKLTFLWNSASDTPPPPGATLRGYKLFSVTGQPTPVGEASSERGAGSFSISEPGAELTYDAVGDPGTYPTIEGRPILETYATPTGDIRCADLDRDGRLDLARTPVFTIGNDKPEVGARYVDPRHGSPVHLRGYAFEADYDSIGDWPDSMEVELQVHTSGGIPGKTLRILKDFNGYECRSPGASSVSVYHQGVLQATGPYEAVDVSSPPALIILEADLDGDGEYEPLCKSFRPGTIVTISGATFACDEVVFKLGGAISQEDLEGCTVRLNGLPPGEPVLGTRLLGLGAPGSPLATPGTVALPRVLALSPPWPNPALEGSTLRLSLPAAGRVRATVVDVAGRVVASLADRTFAAGDHLLRWDGRRTSGDAAPAGLYFVCVERGAAREARVARLTLLR